MYCEPWIEMKLVERLARYKDRYPGFRVERFMQMVQAWDARRQRWAPYMTDEEIKRVNVSRRKSDSLIRFAASQS